MGKKVKSIFILVSGIAYRVKLKLLYLGFCLELRAQQPVQNDRKHQLMMGESWFQSSKAFTFRDISKKPIRAYMTARKYR